MQLSDMHIAGADCISESRGVYPPWVVEANPLIPPMVNEGDHGMIHALYLSRVDVSERKEMIKAPIIIEEGAKNWRRQG